MRIQDVIVHEWLTGRIEMPTTPLMTPNNLDTSGSYIGKAFQVALNAYHKARTVTLMDVSSAPLAKRRKNKHTPSRDRTPSAGSSGSEKSNQELSEIATEQQNTKVNRKRAGTQLNDDPFKETKKIKYNQSDIVISTETPPVRTKLNLPITVTHNIDNFHNLDKSGASLVNQLHLKKYDLNQNYVISDQIAPQSGKKFATCNEVPYANINTAQLDVNTKLCTQKNQSITETIAPIVQHGNPNTLHYHSTIIHPPSGYVSSITIRKDPPHIYEPLSQKKIEKPKIYEDRTQRFFSKTSSALSNAWINSSTKANSSQSTTRLAYQEDLQNNNLSQSESLLTQHYSSGTKS